uniref:Uncharacterized protein n=1 Tax=Ixodes ricinus TaxID=34613 RepID=A0A147BTF1_IXORI
MCGSLWSATCSLRSATCRPRCATCRSLWQSQTFRVPWSGQCTRQCRVSGQPCTSPWLASRSSFWLR